MDCILKKELDYHKNTSFVYYKNKKELYCILKKHKISYKDYLEESLKHGLEIEYVNIPKSISYLLQKKYPLWNYKSEKSLSYFYPNTSGEFSSPVHTNRKEEWIELKNLCTDLKKNGAQVIDLCGAHIHIDIHELKDDLDAWVTFYKLWAIYEPILYRLMCNGRPIREMVESCAQPVRSVIKKVLNSFDEVKLSSKYDWSDVIASSFLYRLWETMGKEDECNYGVSLGHWLNLHEKNSVNLKKLDTLEFRLANGTLDPVVWQNNVFIITRLIHLSLSNDPFMLSLIKQHQDVFFTEEHENLLTYYNEEHEELLFEFLDLICLNNEQKFDLVKQYEKKKSLLSYVKSK